MPITSDLKTRPRLTRRAAQTRPKTGIVHLGPGAFFRGFNAVYTQQAMALSGGDWGICAVSLRSATLRDDLKDQDGLYHSVTLAPNDMTSEVVSCLSDVLVAPENPGAVLDVMSLASTKIVSLTITEKGYCHAPATGELRVDEPDIHHDLLNPDAPRTAIGFLVHALNLRRIKGLPPFTVLSCDNLPDNGQLVRRVVLEFAKMVDPDLAIWIDAEGAFPSTMVDRITPATTQDNIQDIAELTGFYDPACVLHEPFRQWAIEDDFVGNARPDWQLCGAEMVNDVAAHEAMKLRCLNGAHSTLAYLGYLSGYETISQAMGDPILSKMLDRLWCDEIIATVSAPKGVDVQAYCNDLKARFENPAIAHKTWQIAMDGSQKLPQRLLGTVSDNLAKGRSVQWIALAVAGWMRYVGRVDEKGITIDVKDPMADVLLSHFEAGKRAAQKVEALLGLRDIFPQDLAENQVFKDAVCDAFETLMTYGVLEATQMKLNEL